MLGRYYLLKDNKHATELIKLGFKENLCTSPEGCDSNIGFKVTPHILRHTFATNMIQKGLDVTVLQKILGHESLNTTMMYIHHDFNSIQQKFLEVQS